MIELEDISVRTGRFRLDRISLHVSSGEYLVLLGPSGAGKTTLLETIAGIRRTDSGTIRIRGHDITSAPPEHRDIALVYQDYSLFPHMTVAGNIAYGLNLRGEDDTSAAAEVDRLLQRFGISSLRDRYPASLSGGEQQRVALARALAVRPAVLLLDEPFASLDPRTRDECMRVMQDLRDTRSVTIIQVSHSRDEAYALGDKAAILIDGKIVQAGSTDEIFRHPASQPVAEFVGIENIFTGKCLSTEQNHSRVELGAVTISVAGLFRPGLPVTLAIPADRIILEFSERIPRDAGHTVIRCRVRRIISCRDRMKVELDGPVPLICMVWHTLLPMNGIFPGKEVHAIFRDSDIQIFPGA